jgi:hypothetical protein
MKISTSRHAILRAWMDENERGPAWVAKKVGRTRELISRVYHGHLPISDMLATDLYQVLGIPLLEAGQAKHNRIKKRTLSS